MKPYKKAKIIGLTGGIATGKSTVSNILKDEGIFVIDADILARQVVKIGEVGYNQIVEFFGSHILLEDGELDRKKLGNIVFNNQDYLLKLNSFTHPQIYLEIKKIIEENIYKEDIIVVDLPLLFEEWSMLGKYKIEFDEIWLVYIDVNTQIERLMKRDKIGREDALNRIELQLSMEEKKKKSDRIIENYGDLNNLRSKIIKILDE